MYVYLQSSQRKASVWTEGNEMDRHAILTFLLSKSLGVLGWPPLSLLCPLYASFRAMDSDSRAGNRRCLAFWVIFSLLKIMEWEFVGLFNWLPWWPHVRGMATIFLVLPSFGGASYIYTYFFKQHCTEDTCERKPLDISNRIAIRSKLQEKKPVLYQDSYDLGCDSTERNYNRSTSKKNTQKEWSCALCQISTTSENCLGAHLEGKKHKAKENDLRVELCVTKSTYMLSPTTTRKRTKGMVILENLNQIANLLNPVSRTMRWCGWVKPEFGWTKLNTDGSIHKENAGFGGLLRDYRGEPLCAFVSKVAQGDIFLVELWAIWRGLVLALGLGIKLIWVESDSMSVVKTINKEQPSSFKAGSCVRYIWKLLRKFEKYKVSHTWRETNRAADHLAKMVLCGNDVVLWPDDFSASLCSIIEDDANGRKYPRRLLLNPQH